ncbi:MAG: carboxypeptidase regulatory-like domain-containing protein [Acidobacteria bacterium]|nr:carboxypeptidase regulatory-like domain-containing protein [Acidobacteriota bacterium]
MALYSPDDPWRKPSYEAVVSTGMASFNLRAGSYRMLAGAPGFQTTEQAVETTSPSSVVALMPLMETSGAVRDAAGVPIQGATVSTVNNGVSELGAQHLDTARRATTDAEGRWTLPLPPERSANLLIEAPGFAPAWRISRPADASESDAVLQKGGQLRVQLDRIDAALVITLVAEKANDIPSGTQKQVWARPATSPTLEWKSLAPGAYRIIVQSKDRSGLIAAEAAKVTVGIDTMSDVRVTLPAEASSPHVETLFLPGNSPRELAGLEGFAGPHAVRSAVETATGGALIYLGSAEQSSQLYAVTADRLVIPQWSQRPVADQRRPIRAVALDRGSVALRLIPADEASGLPDTAHATFRDCSFSHGPTLEVPVARDGRVTIPTPTECQTLVLSVPRFASVAVPLTVKRGETARLGDFRLTAAAEAELHVRRQPSGAIVAGAAVRVWRQLDDGREAVIDERTADGSGTAVLSALPTGTELRVEARDEQALASGSTNVQLAADQHLVLDPFAIDDPAKVTITPRLSSHFRDLYRKARIAAVVLQPEPAHDRDRPNRNDSLDEHGSVTFVNVRPARWQLRVVVDTGEIAQPIDAEPFDLAAGDDRKIDPEIEPLVFAGRLVAHDLETRWTLAISDPAGTNGIRRRVPVRLDQTFSVILPRRGTYGVTARAGEEGDDIDIGDVEFSDTQQPVTIVVPEGSVVVKVRDHGSPAPSVALTLSGRRESHDGVRELIRREESDAEGVFRFLHLPQGRWVVRAMTADHRVAEKAFGIDASDESQVELDLQPAAAIRGNVHDGSGQPVPRATVECLGTSTSGPFAQRAETDGDGRFSIELADPPPLARCSVVTATGVVGAYLVLSSESAELKLPEETGALTIADWGTRIPRGDLWLVSTDGRVVGLSAIAAKIGRLGSPLVIRSFPAGSWKVLRVSSLGDWTMLTNGLSGSAKGVADVKVRAEQPQSLRVYGDAPDAIVERRSH